MSKKITYSKRPSAKRRMSFDDNTMQSGDDMVKRHKINETDQLHSRSPPSKPEKRSSLLKKGLKHQGPISMPQEDPEDEVAPVTQNKHGIFDKILHNQRQPLKSKRNNIYGSGGDFEATMKEAKQPKNYDSTPRGSYLPTPPIEAQRKACQEEGRRTASIITNATAVKSISKTQTNAASPAPSLNQAKVKPAREPYQPRTYKAAQSSPPHQDLLGNNLKQLEVARLWTVNQEQSSFLRLPSGIRNSIYDYALGGKTIHIRYETYRTIPSTVDGTVTVVPVFKYRCTVYDNKVRNPYTGEQQRQFKISGSITLLNNICRQLYLETAALPYKSLCFDFHKTFVNMLLMEKRLSRLHLNAITKLGLPDELPQPNMLVYLRNLQSVTLGFSNNNHPKGTYDVVRAENERPRLVLQQKMSSRYSYGFRH
ncbi:hypothetical protein ACN47E_006275 [Coniothyrium glycines]